MFGATWQSICHVGKLRDAGSYFAADVAGMPVAVVRDKGGDLRAFYNVCQHRAHLLLEVKVAPTRSCARTTLGPTNLFEPYGRGRQVGQQRLRRVGSDGHRSCMWWLWPNTCLLRYPGRGNMIVRQIIPIDPDRTLKTYDFYLESAEPKLARRAADILIVQNGMWLTSILVVDGQAVTRGIERCEQIALAP